MILAWRLGSDESSLSIPTRLCRAGFGFLRGHFRFSLEPIIEFVTVSPASLLVELVSPPADFLVHFDEFGLESLMFVGD